MPIITFQPSGLCVEVPPGTELPDAARQAGVDIPTPCGGKGTCGKCMVRVTAGDVDSDSLHLLARGAVAEGYVLACKTRVLNTPVTVEVPEEIGRRGGKFTDSAEDAHLIRQDLLPQKWDFAPLAVKWLLNVPQPQAGDGLADLDRVNRAIRQQWGEQEIIWPLPSLRNVADAVRQQGGTVTVTLIDDRGQLHVVQIEAGDTTTRHYGIAVDIGTTTVAVQLVFLPLAETVGVRSAYNDQVTCGLDVISRINYARRPERLAELRERILKTINGLIDQVCRSHDIDPCEVSNAVLSGNTTMIHLLLGLNPENIRLDPYTPTVMDTPSFSAGEVGLEIAPESWVSFSPAVGSYVGGDITAGILCTDLVTESEEVCLFIDIGTNGEIVIGNRDFMICCACSAGPAFEGGGIGCGMRAALGAIERVEVDPESGVPLCQTVGNVRPKGICGSGMIALLAELFKNGWLDQAGQLSRTRPSPAIVVDGRRAHYILATAAEAADGAPLLISELEIENIIRAKAAIYSACALLLQQVGIGFDDLSKIYIAGGFGRYLNLEQATILGLIPDLPREKFQYIGNSSLTGSYMVLVSRDYRERQLRLAHRMTYSDLSADPSYMEQYTAALFIPHTDLRLFPTVAAARRP